MSKSCFRRPPTSFLELHRWIARRSLCVRVPKFAPRSLGLRPRHTREPARQSSVCRGIYFGARETRATPLSSCCAGIEIINTQIILGSRVVSVLDSVAEGPGFKLQPGNSLRQTVTPIVPLFTNQRNWYSSPLKGYGVNCRPGGK